MAACASISRSSLPRRSSGRRTNGPRRELRGLVGKGERYVHLRNPLPVHLTYFTLSVDENGALKSFDDIYGFDGKVRAALGL